MIRLVTSRRRRLWRIGDESQKSPLRILRNWVKIEGPKRANMLEFIVCGKQSRSGIPGNKACNMIVTINKKESRARSEYGASSPPDSNFDPRSGLFFVAWRLCP